MIYNIIQEDKTENIMPGKKGSHWNKPKVNTKKMNICLSEEAGNKILLLSKLIKNSKKEKDIVLEENDRDSPSGIASQIIEKNIDSYFNEMVRILNEMLDGDKAKGKGKDKEKKN